ncbi:MAG: 3-deoxy-7-phosphoheptulonate synthase, partial [Fimbriimonadaceae bacterium]|nr:3-deoxy-7-phosphoheptulonate synthase [Fimbriimonadaceae bacterium]
MEPRIDDLRIEQARPLISPAILLEEVPRSPEITNAVIGWRRQAEDIITRDSDRLMVIVGPCSIHDPESAREYARRLKPFADRLSDRLHVIMRAYFEKPRSTVGWKGFVNDPFLDGSHRINHGLREARRLLRDIAEIGLPVATEFLDMTVPQFLSDLVTW